MQSSLNVTSRSWRFGAGISGLLLAIACMEDVARAETQGFVGVEGRTFFSDPLHVGQEDERVIPSLLSKVSHEWEGDRDRFRVSLFGRYEGADSGRSHVDVRELFWLREREWGEVRLGIAKEFWGVTESRHLVDIINQSDLVEDIDEEEKLGQPMVNVNLAIGEGEVRAFLLPMFRERSFPSAEERIRAPLPVSDAEIYDAGESEFSPDGAIRYRTTRGAWDVGVSEFYGTSREPRFVLDQGSLRPAYDRIHQQGLDIQYTSEGWLLKWEAMRRTGHGDVHATVGGVEYTVSNVGGSGADVGMLAEYLYDDRGASAPPTPFDDDVYAGVRVALNDEASTEGLFGVTVDRHSGERLWSAELSRRCSESWTVEAEVRAFSETKGGGVLRLFDRDDYVQIRVLRHFSRE
jgi:hypothetical protein